MMAVPTVMPPMMKSTESDASDMMSSAACAQSPRPLLTLGTRSRAGTLRPSLDCCTTYHVLPEQDTAPGRCERAWQLPAHSELPGARNQVAAAEKAREAAGARLGAPEGESAQDGLHGHVCPHVCEEHRVLVQHAHLVPQQPRRDAQAVPEAQLFVSLFACAAL